MIFCFAFTSNLFPIYSALKEKTNENGLKVFGIATVIAIFVYFGVSVLGILIFGKGVILNAGNLISNINEETQVNTGKSGFEAYIMRILYFIIVVTHTPPIFFPGKEAVLIMIDEIDRRSISNTLDERIK
jgi:amino acid permease